MTQKFWRPQPVQPTAPEQDWISRLLKLSIWVSCAGWIVYSLFAFSFDDIKIIPSLWQSILVIAGSVLIVTGAELNTGPMAVAVFGKVGAGTASKLDVRALIVSAIGSMVSVLITFSIRQTRFAESWWRVLALNWGPLIAGITVAADYYAASAELGLLKSDYEKAMDVWSAKMETWYKEQLEWNEAHGIVEPLDRSDWPAATIHHIRTIAPHLNGERPKVRPDAVYLQSLLDGEYGVKARVDVRSDTTLRNWADILTGKAE